MDYQDNGMPKESYGTSNNPMSFRPPQYSAAKFELKNEELELKIIYKTVFFELKKEAE